ncbi:MlaD family protein [Caldithrix abyssi]
MESLRQNNNFKISVYLMVMLSAVLLGIIFYIVGSNQKLFADKYSLYMFKPQAESLVPGAFITLSGLKVGVVGEMKLTNRAEKPGVLIELKIDKKYREFITPSSVAQIKTMGMLGDRYVDISLGKAAETPLREGALIASKDSPDLEQVMVDAAASVSQLRSVLNNVDLLTRQMVEGPGTMASLINDGAMAGDLKQSLNNLKEISGAANNGRGNAARFLNDSTLYQSLLATTRQLQKITAQIAEGQGTLGKMVFDSSAAGHLQNVVQKSDSLLDALNGNGTVGALLKDRAYYEELFTLTRELRTLIEDIKKHPEKYGSFSIF